MKYRYIDEITSDVMFEAYGKDLKELFENAAEAMFENICKIDKVKEKVKKEIEVKGDDAEDLLYNWLQELIALVDTDELFFCKFEIKEINERYLKAELSGEPIQPELGETVVKAVTYHQFKLTKTKKGYKAKVSLDI